MKNLNIEIVNNEKLRSKFTQRLQNEFKAYQEINGFRSVEMACEKIGIEKNSYNQYINNKTKNKNGSFTYPSLENIYKLCNAFGCTADYLLCRTDEKSPQHTDFETTLEKISEYTGLSKNVLVHITMATKKKQLFSNNCDVAKLFNYLFEIDEQMEKLFENALICDIEISNETFKKITDKHKKEKNDYYRKEILLQYLYEYLFSPPNIITDVNEKTNPLVIVHNKFGEKIDNFKVTPSLVKQAYLNRITESLLLLQESYSKKIDNEIIEEINKLFCNS